MSSNDTQVPLSQRIKPMKSPHCTSTKSHLAFVCCLLVAGACVGAAEPSNPSVRTYAVNRRVSEFPTDEDLASACVHWLAGEWAGFDSFAHQFRNAAATGVVILLEWVEGVRAEFPALLASAGFAPGDPAFDEVVALIDEARRRAHRAVNVELIDLYWKVGMVIDRRIKSDGWGRGTVESLSLHLQRTRPGARGFSPQNLWRMRQLYETYRDAPELSTLVRELPWSSNLHILSGTKRREEREFYLRLATQKHWNVRELRPGRSIRRCSSEKS